MAKKRIFTISFLSIIGLLVILGGYWVFGALFSVDKTIPPEKLAKVENGSIARSVVATGKVEPLSKVDIKSKASGLIKYLYVNAGDRVREGQLLVELDKEILEAQLKEARAVLKSATRIQILLPTAIGVRAIRYRILSVDRPVLLQFLASILPTCRELRALPPEETSRG